MNKIVQSSPNAITATDMKGNILKSVTFTRDGSGKPLPRQQNLLIAAGLSHGVVTVLYFVGLGVAMFHPQRKTVHDMLLGTVVVYKLDPKVVSPVSTSSTSSPLATRSGKLEELGKKLSTRPPPPDDTI